MVRVRGLRFRVLSVFEFRVHGSRFSSQLRVPRNILGGSTF